MDITSVCQTIPVAGLAIGRHNTLHSLQLHVARCAIMWEECAAEFGDFVILD